MMGAGEAPARGSRTRRSELFLNCSAVLYVLVCGLSALGYFVNQFDESIPLVAAMRVINGERPFLDFWSIYPPLTYYLNAGAMIALGPSVLAARLASLSLFAAAIAGIVASSRAASKGKPFWFAASLRMLAVYLFCRALHWPTVNGVSLMALSLMVYTVHTSGPRKLRSMALVAAGAIAGAAMLVRLNFGGYAVLAISFDLAVSDLRSAGTFSLTKPKLRALALNLARLSVGPTIALAMLLVFASGKASLLYEQLVRAPSRIVAAGHLIPIARRPEVWFCSMLPLVLAGLLATRETASERPRLQTWGRVGLASAAVMFWASSTFAPIYAPMLYPLFVVGLVSLAQIRNNFLSREVFSTLILLSLVLNYYLIRADGMHILPLLPVVALVLIWGAPRVQLRVLAVACIGSVIVLSPFPNGSAPLKQWFFPLNPKGVEAGCRALLDLGRLRVGDRVLATTGTPADWIGRLYPDREELELVRWFDRHVPREQAVFVGIEDHVHVRVNHVRTYWLLARPMPSVYHELEPGYITELSVQAGIIDELERKDVRWVVLTDTESTGEAMVDSVPARALDEYLLREYRCLWEWGSHRACCRRDVCPTLLDYLRASDATLVTRP